MKIAFNRFEYEVLFECFGSYYIIDTKGNLASISTTSITVFVIDNSPIIIPEKFDIITTDGSIVEANYEIDDGVFVEVFLDKTGQIVNSYLFHSGSRYYTNFNLELISEL